MIEEAIREHVTAHYNHQSGVLLLSDLGVRLRDAQIWPIDEDKRTLAEIASQTPGVSCVRDENQKAFIIVTLQGQEHLAHSAIKTRSSQKLLHRLPKTVLVAFCIELAPTESVYIQTVSPFRYAVNPSNVSEQFVIVDDKFRMPGVYVENLSSLTVEEANNLAEGFLAWCNEHGIPDTNFAKSNLRKRTQVTPPAVQERSPPKTASNALERLLNAQTPEVASKLQIPADIAVTLSRIP